MIINWSLDVALEQTTKHYQVCFKLTRASIANHGC